jgi:hypothetical protein
LELSVDAETEASSLSTQLLADIKAAFDAPSQASALDNSRARKCDIFVSFFA